MLPAKLNVTVRPTDTSGVIDSSEPVAVDPAPFANGSAPPSLSPLSPPAADPARVVAAVAAAPLAAAAVCVLLGLEPVPAGAVVALGVLIAVVVTLRSVVAPLIAEVRAARAVAVAAEIEVVAQHAERDFRERLERALEHTDAEPTTLRTGLRAIAELVPDAEISLLLNVPDEPRIGWSVRLSGGALDAAVAVPSMPTCSALTSGETAVTRSSSALDACAHLHDPGLDVAATCVPLRLGDRMLGSVCIVDAPGDALTPELRRRVEWVVDRTGARVAEQRRVNGPVLRARTDPLTGLPGASALQHHLRDLVRSLSPFCVAVIEIDHYGEIETDSEADEAIRIVADVLCATLRPDDMVCRLDGARFAAVLRQCSADQATSALERARESMTLLLADGDGVHVTCSSGVVESHRATSIDEILQLSGEACEAASDAGGNRVVVATARVTSDEA